MKNSKFNKTDRSRAPFRSSAASKTSGKEGNKAKSPFRSSEKPKFGEKAEAGRKSRFGSKTKPGFKSKDKTERDETPRFGEKPHFGNRPRYEKTAKPAFHTKAKPAFRKPRVEAKVESYKPTEGNVLLWGLHAVRAAYLNPKRRITRLWLTESGAKVFEATQNEARDALLKRPDPKRVERDELDRITPPGSVHQGIVIESMPLPEVSLHDVIAANPPPDLLLVLDQVTDPHNVGAILRSAAAFGAGAIVMTERNAPTTTGVLAKSASGALEHTPMIHVVNLARTLDELREAGYWCVGLAEEGEKDIAALDISGRTALVLGAEGEGLRHLTRQKCDELARLPTRGPIGSLNVSNAAAVALYEVRRQTK